MDSPTPSARASTAPSAAAAPRLATSRSDALAEDIVFGVEQTALCLSTDAFTDPLISTAIQRRLGSQQPNDLRENFIAELGGDAAGFVAFIALRQAFRPCFAVLHHMVRNALDPLYERMVRRKLHLPREGLLTPQQVRQCDSWKDFETETLVQSTTLATLSTVMNAAFLKGRGSPHSWPVLLVSKFAASLVTAGGMIGLRIAAPASMMKLDRVLSTHVVMPALTMMHNMVPAASLAELAQAAPTASASGSSHYWQSRLNLADEHLIVSNAPSR